MQNLPLPALAPARMALRPFSLQRLPGLPILLFFWAVLMLGLTGCATGPRTIEIPRERLEASLARRFPLQAHGQGVLGLLDLRAAAPSLQLQPEANRIRAAFALTAGGRLLRQPLQGGIELSFGLRWEPVDTSIRLADVRVERLDLQGLPDSLGGQLVRLGPLLAERLLEGAALHTFTPEEVARAQGWTPSEIRVTAAGVRITLQPPVR